MSSSSTKEPSINRGLYRHYKGNFYQVIDLVRHSETEEWLVLYRPEYGDRKLWVRPYEMFFETLSVDGVRVSRFSFLEAPPNAADN